MRSETSGTSYVALLVMGTNFSISTGVGFIALFGVATPDGVVLVNKFRHNLRQGRGLVQHPSGKRPGRPQPRLGSETQ